MHYLVMRRPSVGGDEPGRGGSSGEEMAVSSPYLKPGEPIEGGFVMSTNIRSINSGGGSRFEELKQFFL